MTGEVAEGSPGVLDPSVIDPRAVDPRAVDPRTGDSLAVDPRIADPRTVDGEALAAETVDAGAAERERLARVRLGQLAEPGDRSLGILLDRWGAEEAVGRLAAGALPSGLVSPKWQERARQRLGTLQPEDDLRRAAGIGARFICPGDLEWPTQLDVLGDARPVGLWVRGEDNLRFWALRSVSVVGARSCTEYGRTQATQLGAELAERGWTVVSGAAYGIDAAAHGGALVVGGRTVAVLACGVDVPYPRGHESLLGRIAREGLIVSELPPGATVTKSRFLERNRVIATLTRGTVVIEAALRSGALSTANRARTHLRHVMALPGPVTSRASAGCHEIVRTAGASLVTNAADVLDLVADMGSEVQPRRREVERVADGLDPVALRLLESLSPRRAASLDGLVQTAGLGVAATASRLGQLEGLGLAERDEGGWRLTRAHKDRHGSAT